MHLHINTAPLELCGWLDSYPTTHLDIGCGDGSAALAYAREHPDTAVVGIDICLDNLDPRMRRPPDNLKFLRGDATRPLEGLEAQFDAGSIAFPFGSLLRGLVGGDGVVIDHILSPLKPGAPVRILINESAVRAANGTMPAMPSALGSLQGALRGASVVALNHHDIRHEHSRWAKRIGYGKPSKTWLTVGRKAAFDHMPVNARHDLLLASG